jgi:hypothetical protein
MSSSQLFTRNQTKTVYTVTHFSLKSVLILSFSICVSFSNCSPPFQFSRAQFYTYIFYTSATRNIATCWTTKVSNPDRFKKIFFFKSSRGILGLKQFPVQWKTRLLLLGKDGSEQEAKPLVHVAPNLK